MTLPISTLSPVTVTGWPQSGNGLVIGRTHERDPRYEIAFDDGRVASQVPAEFVAEIWAVQLRKSAP